MSTSPSISVGNKAELQHRAELRLQLASAYYAEGQYQTALQELDQALKTGERRSEALGLRALVLMQLGDAEAAMQNLRSALQVDPDNPNLLNNMGWFLCEAGHPEKGLVFFDRALANRSYASPAKALINAGRCSLALRKRSQAEEFFRRAVAADPEQVIAYASLAKIAYESGDYLRARTHMLRVLASEQAVTENYLMAISIERKLGDRIAEQSVARQWRKRFPDAAPATGSSIVETNER